MSDTRTLRQKLEAMAEQAVSPNEALIAKQKLDALGPPDPPKRPPAAPAPAEEPFGFAWTNTGTASVNVTFGMYPSGLNWTGVIWPGDERER